MLWNFIGRQIKDHDLFLQCIQNLVVLNQKKILNYFRYEQRNANGSAAQTKYCTKEYFRENF